MAKPSAPDSSGRASDVEPYLVEPGRFGRFAGRGVAAGIAAGLVMALWFLLVDGAAGQPFRTPTFISSGLLGRDGIEPTFGLVTLYTLLHFAAWSVVGIGAAWLLSKLEITSPVLLGLALGFGLFDLVFYGSVWITGVDVVALLGWPPVLVGNVLGGVTLLSVLHVTSPERQATWWERLSDNLVVREGVITGLLGAVAVAAWFLAFDVVQGQPLFTPGALGSAIFLGADSFADVRVDATTVLGYSVLHLVAFVFVGIVAAGFVSVAEEMPPLILAAVLLFAVSETFFLGAMAILAEFVIGRLSWWNIGLSTLVATVVMAGYLWKCHPKLRAALAERPLQKEHERGTSPPGV